MPFLVSTAKTFVVVSVSMLFIVLTASLFVSPKLNPWHLAGVVVGVALASGVRAQWEMSKLAETFVLGAFVAICLVLAQWLSTLA
ncbi:MAG: hypothetical protein ABI389_16085 [Rhodanobacter sp.]